MSASFVLSIEPIDLTKVSLLCISSANPGYVMAESFNHIFRTTFKQTDEFSLMLKGEVLSKGYPMYRAINTIEYTAWFLVKNKHNHSILLDALRNVDYFLVIIGCNHKAWAKCVADYQSWFPNNTGILIYDLREEKQTVTLPTQLSLIDSAAPPKTITKITKRKKHHAAIVDTFLPCIWDYYISMENEEDILAGKIREEWKKNGYSALSKSLPYSNSLLTETK